MQIITRPVSDQQNKKTKQKKSTKTARKKEESGIMWANKKEVAISVCHNTGPAS